MPVWRKSGESMGIVDLRQLGGDEIVIHYGGSLRSVDAYTFANSLVAFADTVRAVNAALNPGQSIEIKVEALGSGSFRARLKKIRKGISGLISQGPSNIIWGLVVYLIIERVFDPSKINIIVNDDSVVIERGDDRVILPKETYDQLKNVRANVEVNNSIARTFDTVDNDPAIENFGFTPKIRDDEPLIQIPREDFGRIASARVVIEETQKRRPRSERARLLIVKAWFKKGAHKWNFEWNGVPLAARIVDQKFLDAIDNREIALAAGDALDATIEFDEVYDNDLGIFISDPSTYRVTTVWRPITKPIQRRLE